MGEHEDIRARVALGKRIRELRRGQHISLRRFALMIGMSYPYLSKVENAKQAITIDGIERIAAGLGVGIHELFAEGPEAERPLDTTG